MRIVLAGASGFLGRPLTESLRQEGHSLTALTRRPRGDALVHEIAWQPDGTAGPWAEALDDADAVVNLAGESIAARRWSPERKEALTSSRVLSTRSLVAACTRARRPPPVLISASAVGYYGPRGDEIVTEADPAGRDFLARLSTAWEQEAVAAEASGTRVVLLRTGLVLERDGGALASMLWPFRLGVGGPLGYGRQYWSWIHRADWIALVGFLLAHPSVSGPINATAPTPVTNAAFTRALARALRRPALLTAPAFALRLAMGELADGLLLAGQRVIPERALALGFQFAYRDLESALHTILHG
jgi:uncharacterized protein (TIGR01777 family)